MMRDLYALSAAAVFICLLSHVIIRGNGVQESPRMRAEDLLLPGDVDELLHGEHARDLLLSRDGVTSRDALIVLYTHRCHSDVDAIMTSQLRNALPEAPSLAIMRHDYESTRDLIWFDEMQGEYDLRRKYAMPPDVCACYVFVPQGSLGLQGGECRPLLVSLQQLVEVTWKLATYQVLVVNRHEQPVKVSFSGRGPNLQDLFLPPGSSAVVWAYPSYTARAHNLENDDFLGGWHLLNRNHTLLEVTSGHGQTSTAQQWQSMHDRNKQDAIEHLYRQRWSHAQRTLTVLTQPSLVHNFTQTGYAMKKIPLNVFTELLNIYRSESANLGEEYYPDYFTAWNLDEVNIQQVTLSEQLSGMLAEQLKPFMEDFCHCRLKRTTGKGIATRMRRYPTGSRVRMHVDELVSGHVIGSILHLSRDLAGGRDWPLEVIDFSGNRQVLKMEPGDMVIFEASRLPHGRPSVFSGKFYVNTFFYYTPVSGWENGRFKQEQSGGSHHVRNTKHSSRAEL